MITNHNKPDSTGKRNSAATEPLMQTTILVDWEVPGRHGKHVVHLYLRELPVLAR